MAHTLPRLVFCQCHCPFHDTPHGHHAKTFKVRIAETARQVAAAKAHEYRSLALQSRGDLGGATRDLDEAIKLEPERAELFVFRGLLLDRQGDTTRSIADYDEAIRLNPGFAPAYNNRCNNL